jgi:hypothetical protein
LDAALVDRPTLEQAKGVLVSASCVSSAEVYAQLRRVTARHDVRLTVPAGVLVKVAAGGRPADPLRGKVFGKNGATGTRFPTWE